MNACKQEPDNPFLALLNAIVLVQMTCQKFSSGKHSLVTQATAFFDSYLRLRGECQETYYNLGRAMHQLGILPAAIHYYEKALACRSSVTKGPNDHIFDLSREIAFNLSLVYRASGSLDLARMYLYKYISVWIFFIISWQITTRNENQMNTKAVIYWLYVAIKWQCKKRESFALMRNGVKVQFEIHTFVVKKKL